MSMTNITAKLTQMANKTIEITNMHVQYMLHEITSVTPRNHLSFNP
jgi:hypothetical protein